MQPVLIFVALALAAMPFTAGQTRSNNVDRKKQVEEQLIKMEREFAEAQTRRNLAKLDKLMADDFVATNPLGQVVNKAQVIAQVASTDFELESLVNDEIKIRVYKDAAVATARGTAKGKLKGKDASGQFRYTRVWVKRGGRWQAVAAQSTMIAGQ